MKKIIRTAIVFALAGAALLYTGCTKDYSEDISTLQKEVTEVQNAVKALEAFKTTAQAAIDANKKAIGENSDAIKKAQAGVDALTAELEDFEDFTIYYLNDIYACVDEIYGDISALYSNDQILLGMITDLQDAYNEVVDALNILYEKIAGVAGRITSINAVPAITYNQILLPTLDEEYCAFSVARFQVWPRAAVNNITDDNLAMEMFVTDAPGFLPYEDGRDTKLFITPVHVVAADPTLGFIDVIAPLAEKGETLNAVFELIGDGKLHYSLIYQGVDAGNTLYEIGSDFEVIQQNNSGLYATPTEPVLAKVDEEGTLEVIASEDKKTAKASYSVEFTEREDSVWFQNIVPAYVIPMDRYPYEEIDIVSAETLVELLKFRPFADEATEDVKGPEVSYTYFTVDEAGTTTHIALDAFGPFKFDPATEEFSFEDKTDEFWADYARTGRQVRKRWKFSSSLTLMFVQTIMLEPENVELDTYAYDIPWNFKNFEKTNGEVVVLDTLELAEADTVFTKAWTGDYTKCKIYFKGDAAKTPVADATFAFANAADFATKPTIVAVDAKLPVCEKDTTYVIEACDETNGYLYTLPIEVKVCAAPKVEKAYLEALELEAPITKFASYDIEVISEFVDESNVASFLGNLPATYGLKDVREAIGSTGFLCQTDSVKFDDKKLTGADATLRFHAQVNCDGGEEESTVDVQKLQFSKNYTVDYSWTSCGIKFLFQQQYNTPANTASIVTTGYIQEGVGKCYGTIKGGVYTLDEMHLNNYIKVEEMNDEFYKVGVTVEYEGAEVGATGEVTVPATDVVNPETGLVAGDPVFTWNTYSGRQFNVTARLFDVDGVAIDSVKFALITPKPVVFPGDWTGAYTATRVPGETLTVGCADYIKFYGVLDQAKTENLVNNPTKYATEIIITNDFKATVNGEPFALVEGLHYDFDAATNKIKIYPENVPGVLKIFFPVTVNYFLDYNHKQAEKATATLTINPSIN